MSEVIFNQSPVTIEVAFGDQPLRSLTVMRCNTLHFLKQQILQAFGSNQGFTFVNADSKYTEEDEEDYSMMVLDKNAKGQFLVICKMLPDKDSLFLSNFYFGKELESDGVCSWLE